VVGRDVICRRWGDAAGVWAEWMQCIDREIARAVLGEEASMNNGDVIPVAVEISQSRARQDEQDVGLVNEWAGMCPDDGVSAAMRRLLGMDPRMTLGRGMAISRQRDTCFEEALAAAVDASQSLASENGLLRKRIQGEVNAHQRTIAALHDEADRRGTSERNFEQSAEQARRLACELGALKATVPFAEHSAAAQAIERVRVVIGAPAGLANIVASAEALMSDLRDLVGQRDKLTRELREANATAGKLRIISHASQTAVASVRRELGTPGTTDVAYWARHIVLSRKILMNEAAEREERGYITQGAAALADAHATIGQLRIALDACKLANTKLIERVNAGNTALEIAERVRAEQPSVFQRADDAGHTEWTMTVRGKGCGGVEVGPHGVAIFGSAGVTVGQPSRFPLIVWTEAKSDALKGVVAAPW
jgi:hypothetical protein